MHHWIWRKKLFPKYIQLFRFGLFWWSNEGKTNTDALTDKCVYSSGLWWTIGTNVKVQSRRTHCQVSCDLWLYRLWVIDYDPYILIHRKNEQKWWNLIYYRSMIDEILPIDMRKMKDINELHTQMCNIVQAMVFNKNKIGK